ncbi:3-hydroxyisobutyryl-CoA hydrolase, mitochondrial [Cyphellophora attinorum]|uniref:3-hydroxyisobutyryl-CoA hydrolase n=1 Tax=Cyphellophora attinorum TaxID=1664694 RepID=A0A0N1HSG8_9EURO|nr:3-hydroxyisobutyryl-CoA hydrolase, mitochondrial [Phialophora attinorum]KPI39116.1 3-hydroxyisobutyryl-CoA hydrolase, mitochondrial [Phialophora attinorum]
MPVEQPGDDPDDVLFNSLYGVRTIELNRPKKLNSLNGSMARKILPRLREWEKSHLANVVMITGAGPKAFCAGGDVAELAKQNATPEGQKTSTDYFALEYQLDHLIATYSKPYVAVMDGITMGGGVGLSVHAPFRIATERTVYAMPETTIGFFPDVGGSFALPRLDGEIGTYLALTSERLVGAQVFYSGIATHYMDSTVLAPLTTRLSELVFDDLASLSDRLDLVNRTIAEFTNDLPRPDSYEKAKYGNITGDLRIAIDECFGFNTVEEIIAALKVRKGRPALAEWAENTLKTMSIRSPTSLKVTLQQLRYGAKWDIDETFIREHAMAAHFMAHPDFTEGVTARLINKPATEPQWQPKALAEVSPEDVAKFFEKKEGVDTLQLVEPLRGFEKGPRKYLQYPHARFALPTEEAIEDAAQTSGVKTTKGAETVIAELTKQWGHKLGLKEKVEDYLRRRSRQKGKEAKDQGAEKAASL